MHALATYWKTFTLDRHAPQRISPERQNNLPILHSHQLSRQLFQGTGAGAMIRDRHYVEGGEGVQ